MPETLREALKELLKMGQHDGPCDNEIELPRRTITDGACTLHLAASAKREEAARAALASLVAEEEPVAWTGSGSLSAVEVGLEGHIWPNREDSHPIALYTRPAPSKPVEPVAWRVVDKDTGEVLGLHRTREDLEEDCYGWRINGRLHRIEPLGVIDG